MWSIILAVPHTQLTMCTVYCGRRITAKFYNKITGAHWTWLLLLWLVANMFYSTVWSMRLKHITFQLFSLTAQINFPLLLNESQCNPSCLGFCHFHKLLSPKKHLCCEILFFSTLISVEFYSLPSRFIQLLWVFLCFLQHFCICQCCLRL